MSITTEADPAIVLAYRDQAAAYREAMTALLDTGSYQVAALVAVQAVHSAAMSVLATHTGEVVIEDDPIIALWQRLPDTRDAPALQQGANVLALHEDLTLYAYSVDAEEAREVVEDAVAFCAWSLAPESLGRIRRFR